MSSANEGAELQPDWNIVLVGFMGTGKSAVGRRLARRLGRRFVDTDAWIVRRAGRTIPEVFQRHGEPAFRDLETAAARAYSTPSACVLSTGGGMLGRDENVALLRQGGVLICLDAEPEAILERTAPWEGRPMLKTAANPREAVERLLSERAPRYALADWRIDTTHLSLEQVTEAICERLPSLFQAAATRSESEPDS